MLKSFWRTDEPGSEAGGLCSDFRGLGGRVKRVRMWREAAFRRRPGRRQLPAVWRANPAPRGGPSRCGRHSPECASSSHSTACADLAAPSSPPQTQRRERPVKWTGDATWHLSLIKITCLFFSLHYLFICKDEQQGISQLLLCQQFGQLTVGLHESVPVAAVNHKHHRCTNMRVERKRFTNSGLYAFLIKTDNNYGYGYNVLYM